MVQDREVAVHSTSAKVTLFAFKSSPPGFEGVIASLVKEKLSFSKEIQR